MPSWKSGPEIFRVSLGTTDQSRVGLFLRLDEGGAERFEPGLI